MAEIGIRALKQNASAVVERAAAGEEITVTDRGRPVAQLTALPSSRLQQLINAGLARPPRHDINDLPMPKNGPSVSRELARMRDEER